MLNLENIEMIDTTARDYISEHRDPNKFYTGHDITHLWTVARLTELASLSAVFAPRDLELSRITGWFHDFERSMNETDSASNERLSVDGMLDYLGTLYRANQYYTSDSERKAMSYAILENGHPPTFFAERPDPKQWTLDERLYAALFVADKMEANGVWVIARRSQFVGGARLQAPDADLPKFGLQPGRDEAKTVLLEGALRITFKNPENVYPPVFRPLTAAMYEPQKDFMHGLLASERMTIDSYAEMLFETKLKDDPEYNYLAYLKKDGIDPPENLEALRYALMVIGGLTDSGIMEAKGDLAKSAAEVVEYFSADIETPLEDLVRAWEPKNDNSRKWKKEMISYISGQWFNEIRNLLPHR